MTRAVLVDTSALYAALDADDDEHPAARRAWEHLLDETVAGTASGVTHSSVLVEASALIQRRLGVEALRSLHHHLVPVLTVHWIDRSLHERAVASLLAAGRRDVSLVDWTSFELMRSQQIDEALAFDDDFEAQGFAAYR